MITSQQIKALRIGLGLTPTQFAAAVGVTENAVRRWEIGDRHPRWENLVELEKLTKKLGATQASSK
jgi:DNA-binding transcriptional regulator YiaG